MRSRAEIVCCVEGDEIGGFVFIDALSDIIVLVYPNCHLGGNSVRHQTASSWVTDFRT